MNDTGWHAGQNCNGTSQVCPRKKNVQVRCSMGELHSGHRASAAGVFAEIRKSITSADTDFSIGGIAPPSRLIAVSFAAFKSHRFAANRAGREVRRGPHVRHLKLSPEEHQGSMPLKEPEPNALGATTFKQRIRRYRHVPTASANVTLCAINLTHRLELARFHAKRAARDSFSNPALLSMEVRIRH